MNIQNGILHILSDGTHWKNDLIQRKLWLDYGIKTNQSAVKIAIRNLRLEGYPICAGRRGYFLPEDMIEYLLSMQKIVRQINTMRKTFRGLNDTFYEKFGLIPVMETNGTITAIEPNHLNPPCYHQGFDMLSDFKSFLEYELKTKK